MKTRIYGKVLQEWIDHTQGTFGRFVQTEVAYKEYDENGELCGAGSEDFSPERNASETCSAWVWTWDGHRRNKGGHRWFDCRGIVKFRKSERKQVKELLLRKYRATAIELRDPSDGVRFY